MWLNKHIYTHKQNQNSPTTKKVTSKVDKEHIQLSSKNPKILKWIEVLIRHFSKEDKQVHEETNTKTTMRCHLTYVRKTTIKNTRKKKCWWGYGEKQNPCPCAPLVRMLTGVATVKNNIEISQNIKNRTTIWSSNSHYGYLPNKWKH